MCIEENNLDLQWCVDRENSLQLLKGEDLMILFVL